MAGEGESGNHDGDRSQPNGDSSPPSDHGNVNGNPTPSTPDSPTSTGFNTDQLPLNTSQNFSEDDDGGEASVDPYIVRDEPEIEEEEEEGEDLFNDNYMDDYRRMDEQDHYESLDLDDSMEDERDLDQIMADRRAAEVELDTRDTRVASSQRKLPQLLHDQDALDLQRKIEVCRQKIATSKSEFVMDEEIDLLQKELKEQLQKSEERARKHRAGLAEEELLGKTLNRMLQEMHSFEEHRNSSTVPAID